MANYKPITKTLTAGSVDSAVVIPIDLSTTSWGLALVRGTAMFGSIVLDSGAVEVWESTKATTAAPDHITFTDADGIFGITTRANIQLRLKFYNK